MAILKEKHFFYYKDWFVFPLAIVWESNLTMYRPTAKGLSIHFLWWHLRWTFVKGDDT